MRQLRAPTGVEGGPGKAERPDVGSRVTRWTMRCPKCGGPTELAKLFGPVEICQSCRVKTCNGCHVVHDAENVLEPLGLCRGCVKRMKKEGTLCQHGIRPQDCKNQKCNVVFVMGE